MAQAKRLNLRMQKELKLLMTDPPPGVSLPLLSAEENLSSSSLSVIEAQIAGPEGTVYSKGNFTVKIQIPERYPFQPPNVTLVTPIYHPNIDNGGRICLDILNLPPKGAWQPSLNISTVLTSIGLLLSEPNPDDGLMAETSREYKYNRQAFDEKARSWTEKYATPGASKRINDCGILANPNLSQMPVDRTNPFTEKSTSENDRARKKLRLIGEKLLVKPKAASENCNADKDNVASAPQLSVSNSQNSLVCAVSSTFSQHTMTNCKQISHCEAAGRLSRGNHKQVEESVKFRETIIVSDSEESDDEGNRPLSSRLSLRRMQIAGRQKNKQ